MTAGYVYLLKAETGHWKIGRTKDPNDRLRTFNVKLPFKVEYEHLIKCRHANEVESALHEHYMLKRINGEWFDLSDDDIALIKGMQSDQHSYDVLREEREEYYRLRNEKARIWWEEKALADPNAKWQFQWRGQTWETTTEYLDENIEMVHEMYPIDCITEWYN